MTLLIVGVSLFVAIHLLPSIVPLRSAIFNRLGEGPYKGLYSLVALAGLGLMIYGKAVADFVYIFNPPEWAPNLARVAMAPALVLIVAANVPGNIKRFTPHPMMWAVLIWAVTHIAANGDQASIILFAPMALFSVIHIVTANMRGATTQEDRLPVSADIKVIAIGLATYAIFAAAHPYLFRMPAF
jgi:uncharacterized membrane protein